MLQNLRVKICGITDSSQAIEIVKMGATTLGFICVPQSPRYVTAQTIAQIVESLNEVFDGSISTIGVFADDSVEQVLSTAEAASLSGVQLHGSESVAYCAEIKRVQPALEVIKAFRIRDQETLEQVDAYLPSVDALLLDAYHPQALGGTGLAWDWSLLKNVDFSCPWLLAGGINPGNVIQAVESCRPSGIDLSSGVEQSPGVKDLTKVQALFAQLEQLS